MSNQTYPVLPGLDFGTVRTPVWKTEILTAASDRETRGTYVTYPRWKFTLKYEFLRGAAAYAELQTLVGFFNQMGGSFDNFLFRDPSDYTVSAQAIGLGDGSNKDFRLVRARGGFVEPVLAPDTVWLYLDRGNAGNWRIASQSRSNYLGRTNDLTNAYWTKAGTTITADGATNPDGEATADLVVEDTTNAVHLVRKNGMVPPGGAGAKHLISVRVKPAGRTKFSLSAAWTGTAAVDFDVSAMTGTKRGSGSVLSWGLRALAGGWFRLWIVCRPTDATAGSVSFNLLQALGSNTYVGDGTSGAYMDGMQIEVLDEDAPEEPTDYIKNTTGGPLTVPADFTMGTLGYLSMQTAPPAGATLSWSGSFYYRCRFTHDELAVDEFMRDLYSAKKVEFITEK